MRIVLLRHGEPGLPAHGRLRAAEFHRWIDAYDAAGLKQPISLPDDSVEVAGGCDTVVCSDLPRSIESDPR